MIRTITPRMMHRRVSPVRPQPPRQPKYIAVALAGMFAIVPAGLSQAVRPVDAAERVPAMARSVVER